MEMSDFGGSTTTMHSSINRAGESRALGAVGDVGTREAVGTIKGQWDIGSWEAVKKFADATGQSVEEASSYMRSVGLSQEYGTKQAFEHAYETAKEHGFSGSESDFQAFMSEFNYVKAFEDAGWSQRLANQYFNGDVAKMYESVIGFERNRTMGAIQEALKQGWDPNKLSTLVGGLESLSNIGRVTGVYGDSSERDFILAERARTLQNIGKAMFDLKLAEMLPDLRGKSSGETLLNFYQKGPGKVSMTLNEQEAKAFSKALGRDIKPGLYAFGYDGMTGKIFFADGKTGTKIWEGSSVVEENKVASTSLSRQQAQRIAQAFDNALKSGDKSALAVVSALRKRGIDVFDENGKFDKDKYAQWLEGQNVQATFGRDALGREVITSLRGDKGILFMSESGISTKDVNLDQEVDKKTLESTSLSKAQAQKIAEAFDNALRAGDRSAVAVVNSLRKRGIDVFDEGGRFDKDKYAEWLTGQNVRVSFGTDKQGNQVITSMVGDDGIIFRSEAGISTKAVNLEETVQGKHHVGEYVDPVTKEKLVGDFWSEEIKMSVPQYLAKKLADKLHILESKGLLNLQNVGTTVSTMKLSYSQGELERLQKLPQMLNLLRGGSSDKATINLSEEDIRTLSKVDSKISEFSPGQAEVLITADGVKLSQGDHESFISVNKLVSVGEIPLAGKLTNLVEKKVASTFDGEKAVDQSLGKYEVGFSGDVSFDSYNRSRIVKDNVEWNKGVDRRNVGTEAAREVAKFFGASEEGSLKFANKVAIVGYGLDKLGITPMIPRKTAQVLGRLFENRNAGRVLEASVSHPKPPERVVWIP
jgi:uncharacterized protein YejL (UPF0352 family)